MYIHPFWCGVAATIIVETVVLMGAIIWIGVRKTKEKEAEKDGKTLGK